MASLLDAFTTAGQAPDVPQAGVDPAADYSAQVVADKFIRDHYVLTPDVDQTTGAPMAVRATVETQGDPGNRQAALQAALQQHYGQQYDPNVKTVPGTSNFVYTDPSGKRMLYNPTTWGVGDLTRLEQPAAGIVGAVGGGVVGSLLGPGAGSLVGAGVGTTAGSELLGQAGRDFLGIGDVRTPGQVAGQDVLSTGANIALPGLLGVAGKAILPTAGPVARAAIDLDKSGVAPDITDTLTPGSATGNRALQRTESGIAQAPGGGGISDKYTALRGKIEEGTSNVADTVAGSQAAPDPDTFATTVYNVAQKADQNWRTRVGQLTTNLDNQVGAAQVDVTSLITLRDQMQAALQRAPRTLGDEYNAPVAELNKIIEDAGDGKTLPFSTLLKARTMLGDKTYGTQPGDLPSAAEPHMKDAYNGIRDTLDTTANNSGQPAADAWNDYNTQINDYRAPGGQGDAVKAMLNKNYSADVITNLAKSTVREQQSQLTGLLGAADPADRQLLASGMVGRLGLDNTGTFNPTTFAKNWGAISDANKSLLFGANPDEKAALDNLATVSNSLKTTLGTAGHSNTGAIYHILSAIPEIAAATYFGGPMAGAGMAAAHFGAPAAAAQVMTSPAFVRWISGVTADNSTGAWGRWAGRLGAVGEADPRIAKITAALQTQMLANDPANPPAAAPPGGQSE